MFEDVDKVLISEEELQARVKTLAKSIDEDYQGREVLLIGVLKGALMFMVDLAREITVPVSMDFMAVSSYGETTKSSGVVRITKDLDMSIEGKDVLIVEDIVDSGLTLAYILEGIWARNPSSVRVCALLDKKSRRTVDLQLDYIGFEIPDEFVVGYGLDFRQKYRNLRCLGVLKPDAYL